MKIHKCAWGKAVSVYCGAQVERSQKTVIWSEVTCDECRKHEDKLIKKTRGKKWERVFG